MSIPAPHPSSDEALIEGADSLHSQISCAQRDLLDVIAKIDRRDAWEDSGAHDMAHWVSMRYGISYWKASRWVEAARALDRLPRLSDALASGLLGIDKVVELARFAMPQTEDGLIAWAEEVSTGAIRRKGDLARRRELEEVQDVHRDRFLDWRWTDEGRRFGLQAELPADQGAVVASALARLFRRPAGAAGRRRNLVRIGPPSRCAGCALLGTDRPGLRS